MCLELALCFFEIVEVFVVVKFISVFVSLFPGS